MDISHPAWPDARAEEHNNRGHRMSVRALRCSELHDGISCASAQKRVFADVEPLRACEQCLERNLRILKVMPESTNISGGLAPGRGRWTKDSDENYTASLKLSTQASRGWGPS
jgi:hypothetical protein